MFSNRSAQLLVAAFVLVFFWANFSSGQIPRPPSLAEMTRSQANQTERTAIEDGAELIATTRQRIDRDHVEIRVLQGGKAVELFAHFHELVTATPANRQTKLDELAGKSITLIPSEKREIVAGAAGMSESLLPLRSQADHWDIFTGVGGVGDQNLADNIFKVRQVLLSTRKNPLEVHIDGRIVRLKPGQALLVL